jgi:hypothetical protein
MIAPYAFVAVSWAAVAAGWAWIAVASMSPIFTWSLIWWTASVASLALWTKWYDTHDEAIIDISWDIALWIATGAIGGKMVQKWWTENVSYLSIEWKKNAWIFLWDITWSMGLELWRMYKMNSIYHSEWLFQN